MRLNFLKQLVPAIVLTLVVGGFANAQIVNFTNTTSLSPSNAFDVLNGQMISGVPFVIPITGNAEFPNLTVTVTGATSDGTNATFSGVGTRFGITSGIPASDGFNNTFGTGESLTLVFSEDVNINRAQFGSLNGGDSIDFGPLTQADDPNNLSDLYDYDIDLAAGDSFTIAANAGNVGIRTINFTVTTPVSVLLGDINMDGSIDFLDIAPFIALLGNGDFKAEADVDQSGDVDFLDISPFIALLSGG